VVDKVTAMDSNVSTLQSYTVSKGTNFGVGPDVFQELTSETQNTAIGYGSGEGTYGLTTGSGNVTIWEVVVKQVSKTGELIVASNFCPCTHFGRWL